MWNVFMFNVDTRYRFTKTPEFRTPEKINK